MISTYAIIIGLMAPIWLPIIRFVISLFRDSKSNKKTFIWCYAVSFAWAFGWVSFQWAIKIPSGIGYGLALITAWPVMLGGLALDPIFRNQLEGGDNAQP